LIETQARVTDICYEVGYGSLGTFTTRFNNLVGMSPNAFRRFSKDLRSIRLAELIPFLRLASTHPSLGSSLTGTLKRPAGFDGVIFTGLFRGGIPQGRPVGCALTLAGCSYAMPMPLDGEWNALSVALPWAADASALLTLRGAFRGWLGDSTIVLHSPQIWHPPILTAIPLLLNDLRRSETPQPDIKEGAATAAINTPSRR
jgi:hypothetical protein